MCFWLDQFKSAISISTKTVSDNNGKGFAVLIPNQVENAFKLPKEVSSNLAETYALYLALRLLCSYAQILLKR